MRCAGRLACRLGLSGRAKATSRVTVGAVGAAVVLVGRCPGGEAVCVDVPEGRLVALGLDRPAAGFSVWVLTTLRVCFEIVSDGQSQGSDGVSSETESAAPSGCQAAFVLDHRDGWRQVTSGGRHPTHRGCDRFRRARE